MTGKKGEMRIADKMVMIVTNIGNIDKLSVCKDVIKITTSIFMYQLIQVKHLFSVVM